MKHRAGFVRAVHWARGEEFELIPLISRAILTLCFIQTTSHCVLLWRTHSIMYLFVCRLHMLVMLAVAVFSFFDLNELNIHFLIVWSCPLFWDSEQKSDIFSSPTWNIASIILATNSCHFLYSNFSDETYVLSRRVILYVYLFLSNEETLLNPWNNCNLSQCDTLKTVKDLQFDKYVIPHITWP